MTAGKRQEYEAFVKGAWAAAANHKEGAAIEKADFLLLNDNNGNHLTDSQKIRHVYKKHGNEKTEKSHGNIAIKESDVVMIPEIITNYDYIIKNVLYDNREETIYAKCGKNNTFIYIEHPSKRKKGGTMATFFNMLKQKDASAFLNILKNNNRYSNIENAKVIIGSGGGGNPSDTYGNNPTGTAATSVGPADIPSSSANPAEKSTIPAPRSPLRRCVSCRLHTGWGLRCRRSSCALP